MNLWTFVCIVALAGIISECYKYKVKSNSKQQKNDTQTSEALERILHRLDAIEKRTGNLETVMIDAEKERKFSHL